MLASARASFGVFASNVRRILFGAVCLLFLPLTSMMASAQQPPAQEGWIVGEGIRLQTLDKITARISRLCEGLDTRFVDPIVVSQKVVQGMFSGVTTSALDVLAAETCAYMNVEHPDYARLAARISISNLQRETSPSFSETVLILREYCDPVTGENAGLISDDVSSPPFFSSSCVLEVEGCDETGIHL